MGEGKIGHWTAINDDRRPSNVVLEVHSVTHWNLMQWKFTDNCASTWTAQYPKWPHKAYFVLSHCLCTVLRHVGCLDGDFLGCDSGGWYHLKRIAELLHWGVTEHNVEGQKWRPRWMMDLETQFRGKGWLQEMTQEKWASALLRAMAPGNHAPPRYRSSYRPCRPQSRLANR
jgi:hypothetical protein